MSVEEIKAARKAWLAAKAGRLKAGPPGARPGAPKAGGKPAGADAEAGAAKPEADAPEKKAAGGDEDAHRRRGLLAWKARNGTRAHQRGRARGDRPMDIFKPVNRRPIKCTKCAGPTYELKENRCGEGRDEGLGDSGWGLGG
jgi:hypothetical protein